MTANPTVLVVEDEALIRLSVADALRDFGWWVHEAANAAEALKVMESSNDLSLMFTDIDMPGEMNGLGLARKVLERWPLVMIVITSGMAQLSADDLPPGVDLISKPYFEEQLEKMLRACLRS